MFRKTVWRKSVSDTLHSHQDRALNTTIFILKEFGPIGFLLQEDGESKNYKVCLGDPHTCTCPTFQKEKDLCTHICWILMRKFRLPRDHEYCFQFGLAERQILELLQGQHVIKTTSSSDSSRSCPEPSEEGGGVRQKEIEKDDICPICQEDLLLKKLPVTYCRFSCGNNIHISCMKVWADHQTKTGPHSMLKCPLCRDDFGTFKQLMEQVKNAGELCTYYEKECLDRQLGIMCNSCRVGPVVGKCFKCTECSYFHLCEGCFKKTAHPQHYFLIRMKRGQSWQAVPHASKEPQKLDNHSMDRSSNSISDVTHDTIPNHVMKSLPMMKVRKESKLLYPGAQCRICLSRFQPGQNVRSLPCKHKFHTDCIDPLIQKSNCCPLDWQAIYNPLTWNARVGRTGSSLAQPSVTQSKCTDQQLSGFFLPGIGLQVQKGTAPSLLRSVKPQPSVRGYVGPSPVESLSHGFQDLSIHSSHIEPYSRMPAMKHSSSLGQVISAPARRRASYPSRPSTFSLRCLTSTQKDRDQQRLIVGVNEPTSVSTACSRIQPHWNGHKGERVKPQRLDVKDLHLQITNSPIKTALVRKQE